MFIFLYCPLDTLTLNIVIETRIISFCMNVSFTNSKRKKNSLNIRKTLINEIILWDFQSIYCKAKVQHKI